MDNARDPTSGTDATYATVSFLTSHGFTVEAPITHLTRHQVVFQLSSAQELLLVSASLGECRIRLDGRGAYAGRAVVNNLIQIGTGVVCEATLEESWVDVQLPPSGDAGIKLKEDLSAFLK